MSRYFFQTTWRIDAPLEEVWAEILHSERWPGWWRGVLSVQEVESGGSDGVGHVRRITWKSRLPYSLVTDVRSTRVEPPERLEGAISGDLVGTGSWRFSEEAGLSVARFQERVSTPQLWMRVLAPAARPIFRWNHHVLMRWGGEGLARRLGARLVACEEI